MKRIWKKLSDQNCWEFERRELRRQVQTSSTSMVSRLVMTTSLTLAGVPRAGELSKADVSQQYVEKMKKHSKLSVSRKNRLKISDKKKFNTLLA